MTKLSKRIKQIREAVDPNKFYSLSDALGLAKQNATGKNLEVACFFLVSLVFSWHFLVNYLFKLVN